MSFMNVGGVLKAIDSFSPFVYAYEWDNCGLIIGSLEQKVEKIAVSLDLSMKSLEAAIEQGCNCIVIHHPLIFTPIKKIDLSSHVGKIIDKVIKAGINVIAAHTNWDVSPEGGNRFLGSKLGLVKLEPISLARIDLPSPSWDGVLGELESPLELRAFAENIKVKGKFSWVKYYGCASKVNTVALCEGSGGDLWKEALKAGASVFVTAELKHHQIQEALETGLSLVEVSHAQMEDLTMEALAEKIKEATGLDVVLIPGSFEECELI